jgi:hypothetical protein
VSEIPTSQQPLHDDTLVEFVGPSSSVLRWPKPLERGIVLSVVGDSALVAWTGSRSVVHWPPEWLRPVHPVATDPRGELRVTIEDLSISEAASR